MGSKVTIRDLKPDAVFGVYFAPKELRANMKRKVKKYSDEPMGKLRVVDDFLPAPEELVFKEDNVKVTMALSKTSVDFFKAEAKKHRTSYQVMIRRLVNLYASQHMQPVAAASGGRTKRRRAA